MADFKNDLNLNWRVGFRVDVMSILDEMQEMYSQYLINTVDCFDSYDEVSNETHADFRAVSAQLLLMKKLGYLDSDECDEMIKCAEQMRFDILESMEKEGEKDGSKEE